MAPLIDGIEGERQGLSVPMLSALPGGSGQTNRGAVSYIQMKPAPAAVPLAQFTYRGQRFGGSQSINASNMVIPGTGGQNWYVVDMDLLKSFRVPFEQQTTVTQTDLDGWLAALNVKNTTPNALGVATYTTPYELTNGLVEGKVTQALYTELEGEFIKYVKNLDAEESLPYAMNNGAVMTSMSGNYSTHDMTVGDFDGDGEYEIVVKWRAGGRTRCTPSRSSVATTPRRRPEYIDVYKQDGTMLFRIDMGYNVRSANDHETQLYAEDFDGDGKSELMLKTALGTRIGNWDEASQSVVYQDSGVVGGEDGLASTTPKFQEYFATGNTAALDTYWSLLNSFSISYRSPTAGGGNDSPNDPLLKRWIKTYSRRADRSGQGRPGVLLGLRVERRSRPGRARGQRDLPVPLPGQRRWRQLGHDACHPARQLRVPRVPGSRRRHVVERLQGAGHGAVRGLLAHRTRGRQRSGVTHGATAPTVTSVSSRLSTGSTSSRCPSAGTTTGPHWRPSTSWTARCACRPASTPRTRSTGPLGGRPTTYRNRRNHNTNSADLDGRMIAMRSVLKAMVPPAASAGRDPDPAAR